MSQKITVNQFGSYNRGKEVDLLQPNDFIQMDYMTTIPDLTNISITGILNKQPNRINYKAAMPAAGRTRGIHQYFPILGSSTSTFLITESCTTDYSVGKVYALDVDNNSWNTLFTDTKPYHVCFGQYNTKVYLTSLGLYDGSTFNRARKWWYGIPTDADKAAWVATLPVMKNKKYASNIAAATLTWTTGSTTVTSDIDISASVFPGDWIRKSSTSLYWDEVKKVAAGGLSITLMNPALDNGASSAGGAQKANDLAGTGVANFDEPYRASFIIFWKEKCWMGNLGASTTPYPSRIFWSITGDPENWDTTAGAGFLDIDNIDGESITALAAIDDYLFIFKDFSYHVYKWTGDLDVPIQLVKSLPYGCNSIRTIQRVDNALIYFTGTEVRMTDGTNDVSISNDIQYVFKNTSVTGQSSSYFTLTAADNKYPWSIYDPLVSIYTIFVGGNEYQYDLEKKKWCGVSPNSTIGASILIATSSSAGTQILAKNTSTDQLLSLDYSKLDYTDAGVIFSAPLVFPSTTSKVNQKAKIKWVEFVFHPKVGCNTTIGFDWWDFSETKATPTTSLATNTNAQSFVLKSTGTDLEQRVRQRFYVQGAPVNQFGWVLWEDSIGSSTGTDGWGLISAEICYDPMGVEG